MNHTPLSRKDYIEMSGSSENRAYFYLRIVDFPYHPDIISSKLGLQPTAKGQKGEEYSIIGDRKKIADVNYWEYEREIISDDFFGDLVESFIEEIIEPRVQDIQRLEGPKDVIFTVAYYYHSSNNVGVAMSARHLKVLADVSADLDMDIYTLHED